MNLHSSRTAQTINCTKNPIPRLIEGCFLNESGSYYNTDVLLVCHQHILTSTRFLFEYLVKFICPAENIFLLGKVYSTIPNSASVLKKLGIKFIENTADYKFGMYHQSVERDIDSLWEAANTYHKQKNFKKILLLDEGGFLARNIPESLKHIATAIEQTAYGIFDVHHNLPVINVAQSQTKKSLEAPQNCAFYLSKVENRR